MAKINYFSQSYRGLHHPTKGLDPEIVWGEANPDGDATRFEKYATGTLYIKRATAGASPLLWLKGAAADEDADWDLLPVKMKRLPITDLTNGENDTGWDLPARGLVLGVWVHISTAEATASTKTIDVGLASGESGGDADGFLDGVSTATTGLKGGTLVSSGQTLGALLRVDENGSGVLVPQPHIIDSVTARSVTFTLGEAANELAGTIYILYIELP